MWCLAMSWRVLSHCRVCFVAAPSHRLGVSEVVLTVRHTLCVYVLLLHLCHTFSSAPRLFTVQQQSCVDLPACCRLGAHCGLDTPLV
jgi:hypothetical protein